MFKSIGDNGGVVNGTSVSGGIESNETIFTPFGGPRVFDGENVTI